LCRKAGDNRTNTTARGTFSVTKARPTPASSVEDAEGLSRAARKKGERKYRSYINTVVGSFSQQTLEMR